MPSHVTIYTPAMGNIIRDATDYPTHSAEGVLLWLCDYNRRQAVYPDGPVAWAVYPRLPMTNVLVAEYQWGINSRYAFIFFSQAEMTDAEVADGVRWAKDYHQLEME